MRANSDPPIRWGLWRRLRYFGGIGVASALTCSAVLRLGSAAFGDRDPRSLTGWRSPDDVRFLSAGIVAAGLVFAVLLPLYRWRYGGAVIGVVGVLSFVGVGSLMSAGDGLGLSGRPQALWQGTALLVLVAIMVAVSANEARSHILGEADEAGSGSPPRTSS